MENENGRGGAPNNITAKSVLSEIFSVAVGSVIYALAIVLFLSPSGTIMGGATGVATTVNIIFPSVPIGMTMLVVNIPLLLIGLRLYGWHILWRIVVATVTTSVTTDIFEMIPVHITDDPLLCAIMGGLVLGVGCGMLISRGYNTGGSDLAAVMLKKTLLRSMTTGRIIFILDIFVIAGSALITKNFTGIFYSIVATYANSFALDYIIDGNKSAKMTLIISDKYEEIANAIFDELERGVTILHGLGWYSGTNKNVILCVVKPHELFRVKTIVKRVDPVAFMILTDAKEVMGEGFVALDL